MEHDQAALKDQPAFIEFLANKGLTQAQTATLITEETSRKMSHRTVRAWLSNPSAVLARACPLGAVVALKKAIDQ
jgi:hypothetical protein